MGERDFTVGAVLGGTFRLIGRHRRDFTVAASLLAVLPVLLNSAANADRTRALVVAAFGGAVRTGPPSPILFGAGALGSVAVLLLSVVLFGFVVSAALGDARGEAPRLGRDLRASLRLFLPNLAIGTLFYLALGLGLSLFVVPGLMLQCAWYVVIPAYMAERPGLFRAFGRSRALTKGHRWRVFGVLLLYGLALVVAGGLNYLVTLSFARNGVDGSAMWAYRIAYTITTAGLSVIGSAAPAVAYVALDRAKGGALSADLAEAFA